MSLAMKRIELAEGISPVNKRGILKEVAEVAQMHKSMLSESFLSSLGENFLRCLYRTLAEYPDGILIVTEEKGNVTGFVSGVLNIKNFYRYFLRKNFWRLPFLLLSRAFSAAAFKKILELKFYCQRSKENIRFNQPSVNAELLSMAVQEGFQRKGAGAFLFSGLAQEFKQKNVDSFKIIVGAKLKKAVSFYQKMGCVLNGQTEIHRGDESYIYFYRIN